MTGILKNIKDRFTAIRNEADVLDYALVAALVETATDAQRAIDDRLFRLRANCIQEAPESIRGLCTALGNFAVKSASRATGPQVGDSSLPG